MSSSFSGAYRNAKPFSAKPQRKSDVATSAKRQDESPANSPVPQQDIELEQRVGNAGETIPIVFGKRASNVGGVWVQAPLVKKSSYNFDYSFCYVLSQGDIAASVVSRDIFLGSSNAAYITGSSSWTIATEYKSATYIASNDTYCPIPVTGINCYINSTTWLAGTYEATSGGGGTYRTRGPSVSYWGERFKCVGTGTTNNTLVTFTFKTYDNATGNDITNAVWGDPNPTLILGGGPSGGSKPRSGKGMNPGDTDNVGADLFDLGSILPSGVNNITLIDTYSTIDTQYDPAYPASSGTLSGFMREVEQGTAANEGAETGKTYDYADITFLGIKGDIYTGTKLEQLFVFIDEGVKVDLYSAGLSSGSYGNGSSNHFIDLVFYLFKIFKGLTTGEAVTSGTSIGTTNITNLAAFCSNYSLFYNGIIAQNVNIIELASDFARFFLLSFVADGGQYRFAPLLPLNGSNQIDTTALTAKATFNESNILPGSFSKEYLSAEERQDITAVMLYREVTPEAVSVQRTVTVAYTATALDAPIEQFDMTEFCASTTHAQWIGKHELARRKHATHSISFETPLFTTDLIPTDVIKVVRQRKNSVGDDRTETNWYQISSVNYSTNGSCSIKAVHFPVDGDSKSEISKDVVTGSFRVS